MGYNNIQSLYKHIIFLEASLLTSWHKNNNFKSNGFSILMFFKLEKYR